MHENLDRKVEANKMFLMEYQEVANFIRHFSSVRYALVSFLATVGLATFFIYFQTSTKYGFLIVAGHVMLFTAIGVCLYFSWETERSHRYLTQVWGWFNGERRKEPIGWKNFGKKETKGERKEINKKIRENMSKDPMNWLCTVVAFLILAAFWLFNVLLFLK